MTLAELRQQAKVRKIPKYYKLNKAQLMAALGVREKPGSDRARAIAQKSGIAKTFAAEQLSQKLLKSAPKEGGSENLAATRIKERLLAAVNTDMSKAKRKLGRELSQDEKRHLAASALKRVATAIREEHAAGSSTKFTPKDRQAHRDRKAKEESGAEFKGLMTNGRKHKPAPAPKVTRLPTGAAFVSRLKAL